MRKHLKDGMSIIYDKSIIKQENVMKEDLLLLWLTNNEKIKSNKTAQGCVISLFARKSSSHSSIRWASFF